MNMNIKDVITREMYIPTQKLIVYTTDKRISLILFIITFGSRYKHVKHVTTMSTTESIILEYGTLLSSFFTMDQQIRYQTVSPGQIS